MNQVIIASDSTTDLNAELIARHGVKILPLGVTLGEKQYVDGVDIIPEDIYAHYEKTGELPKTSAVNIGQFEEFYRACEANGDSVVIFTISASMSCTCNNARLAAEGFPNVFVVDTKNLSTGGGLLLLHACDLRDAGKSAREIAEECEGLTDYVDASFVIDNLEFLHKGGRCSALARFGANMLSLKPCIVVRGGKMSVGKKYRGKYIATLKSYIADQIGDGADIDLTRVFVTHAGCDQEIVDACVSAVKELAPFRELHITRAGCTVSSHCGRNTLGVLFMRKTPFQQ